MFSEAHIPLVCVSAKYNDCFQILKKVSLPTSSRDSKWSAKDSLAFNYKGKEWSGIPFQVLELTLEKEPVLCQLSLST